jgi:hypothetical protein
MLRFLLSNFHESFVGLDMSTLQLTHQPFARLQVIARTLSSSRGRATQERGRHLLNFVTYITAAGFPRNFTLSLLQLNCFDDVSLCTTDTPLSRRPVLSSGSLLGQRSPCLQGYPHSTIFVLLLLVCPQYGIQDSHPHAWSSLQKAAGLLGFPAEISQRILGHLLDQLRVTPDLAVNIDGSHPPRCDRFRLPKEIAAAYLVCKQLKADIDTAFFEYFTLRIPSLHVLFGIDFNVRFNGQGRSLSRIRHLSISPKLLQVLTWEWIVQHLTYLEVLAIEPYRVLLKSIRTGGPVSDFKLVEYAPEFLSSRGVTADLLLPLTDHHLMFERSAFDTIDDLAWEHLSREAYFNLNIRLHLLVRAQSFLGNDAGDMWAFEPQVSIPALKNPAHLRAVLEASPHPNRNLQVYLNFGAVQRIGSRHTTVYGNAWVCDTLSVTHSLRPR